ncbi:hypothetical protein AC1031_021535 [Aphanomyces cochlioides]|nr:hypothetical protein AC1031_021535 [Aphanomyces cochlioides]
MPTVLSPTANPSVDPSTLTKLRQWTGTLLKFVETQRPSAQAVEKMQSLAEIDNHMERCVASRPVTLDEIERTMEWLKQHQEKRKKSTGTIELLLEWFRTQQGNNNTKVPTLPSTWARSSLGLTWEELAFGVLNAPLYVDILHARRLLLAGGLTYANEVDKIEFATWFDEFVDHVRLCDALKQRLLAKKSRLTNTTIRVATQYLRVQKCYEESLWTRAYDDKVLECLAEVELVIRDEENAVADANTTVSTPALELEALAQLFQELDGNAEEGAYIVMLVAWMHQVLSEDDFEAVYACLAPSVKASLVGEGMLEYADHIHRLETFDVEYQFSVVYPRARADIVVPRTSS